MSISIRTIKQDLIEVQDRLEVNDIKGAKDLFWKLKDDACEILESIDIFFGDVKNNLCRLIILYGYFTMIVTIFKK